MEQNKIRKIAEFIFDKTGNAETAIILGSGLGNYADCLKNKKSINYADIPDFPKSTVEGHAGVWHNGILNGKKVIMMQGRFHYYEGHDINNVVLPIRVMKELGVKNLIITNAAGGVNLNFKPGSLMIINDYINYTGVNPLIGKNYDNYGPRFPDMSQAFNKELIAIAKKSAQTLEIDIKEGVYCWFTGPTFETPAEVRMARILGADAVGMSTVPEVIVAHHAGMKILGISCITNLAAGILDKPLNHEEVMETGNRVQNKFRKLIDLIISNI